MYSWTTAFRRSWCFVGVGWGGAGHVLTFMWTRTWSRCYAVAVGWGVYSWVGGGVGFITPLALSHIHHATLLRSLGLPRRRHATLVSVLLGFHAYVMLRYCTFSWTSTHMSCYATVRSLGFPRVRHATLCSWTPTHALAQILNEVGVAFIPPWWSRRWNKLLWWWCWWWRWSRCYAVAVGWGIHSRSCELARQKVPSCFQAFPTLPVSKRWTGPGSLWKISCQLTWFWNAKSVDILLCTPPLHNMCSCGAGDQACRIQILKGFWKNLKRCCKQKTAEKLWRPISWGLRKKKWRFRVGEIQ